MSCLLSIIRSGDHEDSDTDEEQLSIRQIANRYLEKVQSDHRVQKEEFNRQKILLDADEGLLCSTCRFLKLDKFSLSEDAVINLRRSHAFIDNRPPVFEDNSTEKQINSLTILLS